MTAQADLYVRSHGTIPKIKESKHRVTIGVSIPMRKAMSPEVLLAYGLGNGRDVAQLAFTGQVAPLLLMALLVLKPAATMLCLGSGAPGGLFTPSLASGP